MQLFIIEIFFLKKKKLPSTFIQLFIIEKLKKIKKNPINIYIIINNIKIENSQ